MSLAVRVVQVQVFSTHCTRLLGSQEELIRRLHSITATCHPRGKRLAVRLTVGACWTSSLSICVCANPRINPTLSRPGQTNCILRSQLKTSPKSANGSPPGTSCHGPISIPRLVPVLSRLEKFQREPGSIATPTPTTPSSVLFQDPPVSRWK